MKLSKELRTLVRTSVALLGKVILREAGERNYRHIESLREQMSQMRVSSAKKKSRLLDDNYKLLKNLAPESLHQVARSFTLMLELMNACENAYRTHRLSKRERISFTDGPWPKEIIYVLTAHPTEARAPENILIFHQIQQILTEALDDRRDEKKVFSLSKSTEESLLHALELAWHTNIVRKRSPKVKDEAEHIYSLLFRDEVVLNLLDSSKHSVPFFVRSWVGGDKDGHPGVNEKTLLESLSLSRKHLRKLFLDQIHLVRKDLELFVSMKLHLGLSRVEEILLKLKFIQTADAKMVQSLVENFQVFKSEYLAVVGVLHPAIGRIENLLKAFPALVVPLELRESSDVLMSHPHSHSRLAIYKMLSLVERISRGASSGLVTPNNYARGFIISMTDSIEHVRMAGQIQKQVFGFSPLPIIPLFEQSAALKNSDKIIYEMVHDKNLRKAATKNWGGRIEMMVGYSDSSKEAGVLSSRLQISEALPKLEKVCQRANFTPIFFHGSGGSIDRGGGSVEDQTAWWPQSALRTYKVTVQGEMVERSFASPVIAERQLDSIIENVSRGLKNKTRHRRARTLELFAEQVSQNYRRTISSRDFLNLVEAATPYSYLNILKIGSRPAKRSKTLKVEGLRAIPWVLCWTQTRVLFQTWWGVGTAWKNMSKAQRSALKVSFKNDPLFTSYVKALGFTLAKVELSVWRLYLQESDLLKNQGDEAFKMFQTEFALTLQCFKNISGTKELMWSKPWLGESISLRAPMIHPLNMIQMIAKKEKDLELLRVSVTGISSGMMTTG